MAARSPKLSVAGSIPVTGAKMKLTQQDLIRIEEQINEEIQRAEWLMEHKKYGEAFDILVGMDCARCYTLQYLMTTCELKMRM